MRKLTKDQHAEIVALYRTGEKLGQLGARFGVSGERIRQILAANGVTSAEGGQAVQSQKARQARAIHRDEKCIERYGCTAEQFASVKGHHAEGCKAPLYAFLRQREHAADRGVQWKLSFWQWWCVWCDSGKWAQRGRGIGKFVMSRAGDEGAYEVGNVYIGSAVANSTEGKTLSNERGGNNTLVYRAVKAAGGRKVVAHAFGYPAQYISQVCCRGSIPPIWKERGFVEALAKMTNGAFAPIDLLAHVRGNRAGV